MAQVTALVQALKSALKASRLTYADLASAMELSESSIKRKFSRQDFSLAEVDRICGLCDMDISELVKLMDQGRDRLQLLTESQEQEIADDLALLVVAVCVLNHWSFEDICKFYVFETTELVQMLARLDRLQIIELQPGNRIKLLVARNFSWLPGGPIERVFLSALQQDFFQARFEKENHSLIVLNGMLSDEANAELRRKMERLAREFEVLNQEDASTPFPDKKGYTALFALRDWHYQSFAGLRAFEEGENPDDQP